MEINNYEHRYQCLMGTTVHVWMSVYLRTLPRGGEIPVGI